MEDDWTVVNTREKKVQKGNQRKEQQKKEKAQLQKEKELEEEKRQKEREAFLNQYVYHRQEEVQTSSFFESLRDEKNKKQLLKNDMVMAEDFDEDETEEQAKERAAKKKQKAPKKPAVSEVAKGIDTVQLKELLQQYTERFPKNYDLQLKGLAEQFETIFNHADPKKQLDQDKPYLQSLDIPFSFLPKDVVDAVKSWMDKIPEEWIQANFWFLITTLIAIIEKKSPVQTYGIGLKILIQLIAKYYPNVLVKTLPQIKQTYADVPTAPQSSPTIVNPPILKKGYTNFFMWVFGQVIEKPAAGLTVWFHCLLPLICDPATPDTVKDSCLQFIETILNSSKLRDGQMDEVNAVMAYERLMGYAAGDKPLHPRLQAIVPKLVARNFLFGDRYPKRFFTMLLSHAASPKQELREEVLRNLVECLGNDESLFAHWLEIYPSYVAQSNNLMLYITLTWEKDNLSQLLDPEIVVQASKNFSKANKQLLAGTYATPSDKKKKMKKITNPQEVKEINMMNATCKALRHKLHSYTKASNNTFLAVLPVTLLFAGAAVYTALNCCQMEWCTTNALLHDFFKC